MNQPSVFPKTATNYLVAITVLVFLAINLFFYQSKTGLELFFWQASEFHPWQFVSYLFMHGSFTHLLFNMFALWSFGRLLEQRWGYQRFLIFYFVCGIGAALIYMLVNNWQFNGILEQLLSSGLSETEVKQMLATGRYNPSSVAEVGTEAVNKFYNIYHAPAVGASGAIYGILVAFALLYPNYKLILIFLPIPVAAKFFVPVLLLIDLFGGVTGFSIFGYNIAHFAHIGGAIVGFLLVVFWLRKSNRHSY